MEPQADTAVGLLAKLAVLRMQVTQSGAAVGTFGIGSATAEITIGIRNVPDDRNLAGQATSTQTRSQQCHPATGTLSRSRSKSSSRPAHWLYFGLRILYTAPFPIGSCAARICAWPRFLRGPAHTLAQQNVCRTTRNVHVQQLLHIHSLLTGIHGRRTQTIKTVGITYPRGLRQSS